MSNTLIFAQHVAAATPVAMDNPFTGIVPNFTVFGAEFNSLWKKLFAGLWAVVLIWTAARLLMSFMAMSDHKGGGHPQALSEARSDTKKAAFALGGTIAFGAIVSLFFALFG